MALPVLLDNADDMYQREHRAMNPKVDDSGKRSGEGKSLDRIGVLKLSFDEIIVWIDSFAERKVL